MHKPENGSKREKRDSNNLPTFQTQVLENAI
jgi:hypothetical protein